MKARIGKMNTAQAILRSRGPIVGFAVMKDGGKVLFGDELEMWAIQGTPLCFVEIEGALRESGIVHPCDMLASDGVNAKVVLSEWILSALEPCDNEQGLVKHAQHSMARLNSGAEKALEARRLLKEGKDVVQFIRLVENATRLEMSMILQVLDIPESLREYFMGVERL